MLSHVTKMTGKLVIMDIKRYLNSKCEPGQSFFIIPSSSSVLGGDESNTSFLKDSASNGCLTMLSPSDNWLLFMQHNWAIFPLTLSSQCGEKASNGQKKAAEMVFAKSFILTMRKMQQSKYREVTAPICTPWTFKLPMVKKNAVNKKDLFSHKWNRYVTGLKDTHKLWQKEQSAHKGS